MVWKELQPDPDKLHLLLSHTENNLSLNIGNDYIPDSSCEKV